MDYRLMGKYFLFMRTVWKDEKGSFTLEASLVFPLIFMTTLALVLMCLFVYQYVYLYYNASLASDRAAFAWNNSHRSALNGELDVNYINQKNDGLYWRLTDGLIPSLDKTETKLGNALASVNAQAQTSAKYDNSLVVRRVSVAMAKPAFTPEIFPGMYGADKTARAGASTLVTDPVEFMRNFDLLWYYVPTIKDTLKGADSSTIGSFIKRK